MSVNVHVKTQHLSTESEPTANYIHTNYTRCPNQSKQPPFVQGFENHLCLTLNSVWRSFIHTSDRLLNQYFTAAAFHLASVCLLMSHLELNYFSSLSLSVVLSQSQWMRKNWRLTIPRLQWPSVLLYTDNTRNDTSWGAIAEEVVSSGEKTSKKENRKGSWIWGSCLTFTLYSEQDLLTCSTLCVCRRSEMTHYMVMCPGLEGKNVFLCFFM